MLRRLGAEVEVAESAAEAAALSVGCDLIVLDIGLADADGRVLAQSIRAGAAADAAILCVSGLGGAERRDSALAAGADGFAEKPFESVAAFGEAAMAALAARGRATGPAALAEDASWRLSPTVAAHALNDLGRARLRLVSAMATGDVSGVRRAAHFLSGVAGVLEDSALGEATRAVQGARGEAAGLRAIEAMLGRIAEARERLSGANGLAP